MDRGVQIKLPETDPYRAWQRLARLDARHKLLARDIKAIDMRLPDRLIVEPGALGTRIARPDGKNT